MADAHRPAAGPREEPRLSCSIEGPGLVQASDLWQPQRFPRCRSVVRPVQHLRHLVQQRRPLQWRGRGHRVPGAGAFAVFAEVKIKVLQEVGLGYITLGQSAVTLSGGEAQRVKLSTELSKRDTGKTFYILDEPTTGLHFRDIQHLIDVLNKLVDRRNTILVIEHNMDIIKIADHIIDLGPEGGEDGGKILFEGAPEELIAVKGNSTAQFLKEEFL